MKTKFNGKYLSGLVATLGVVAGFAAGFYAHPYLITVKENFELSKEDWMCIASVVDNKKQTYECLVYGKIGRNLEKYPPIRRRDNDLPKGQSIQQK
jgi:hypothetical protein